MTRIYADFDPAFGVIDKTATNYFTPTAIMRFAL